MELLILHLVIFFTAIDKQGAALIVLLYFDMLLLCVQENRILTYEWNVKRVISNS
jgi:hypothetical protein